MSKDCSKQIISSDSFLKKTEKRGKDTVNEQS